MIITYLLAIASPTHGVPASLDYTGWADSLQPLSNIARAGESAAGDHYTTAIYGGIKLDVGVGTGGPLFFTHYSFMGFDPRVRDRFTDYFDNNRKSCASIEPIASAIPATSRVWRRGLGPYGSRWS